MRLLALAAGLFLGFAGAALAQPYATPEDLLEAFYEPYFTGEFYEDETQFRSQALQELYAMDEDITPDGEMGALSFDPYVDGQDFEIDDLSIAPARIDGDTATVDVTFTNFGAPRDLTYELVFEDGGWKIDDLVSNDPNSAYRLSDIFAEAAALLN